MDIEKFNPTVAEITAIVETTNNVVITDFDNLEQVAEVKTAKKALQSLRTKITTTGKDLREDAVKFQKLVIEKEKELVKLITPSEERLDAFIDEIKKHEIRKERLAILPVRKARLENFEEVATDEEILGMDATQFEGYLNKLVAEKNEKERLENERITRERQAELDKKQAEIDAQDAEIKRKQDILEAEERGRQEAEQKAERDRLKKIEDDKQEEERKETERKRLERDTRYQAFLKEHGATPENMQDFYEVRFVGNTITLYKKLATFTE